jgi:hypothetical protein
MQTDSPFSYRKAVNKIYKLEIISSDQALTIHNFIVELV